MAANASSSPPRLGARRWRRPSAVKLLIGAVLLAAGALGGTWAWRYFTSYVSTEDAQIDGHIVFINSRIDGTILHVYVDDTRSVKQGQLLADIDPRDYKVAVEQAEADLAQAQAQVKSALADAQTAQAKIGEDEANYAKAAQDVPRLKALSQRGAAPREDYYESLRQEKVYEAMTAADRAAVNGTLKNVAYRQAVVRAKQAALDRAQLNLSYTRIFAPVAGVVGNRTVQVGQRVAPGQGLMAITPLGDLWVTADFKETYFGEIRPGLPATIHVDALGRDLQGYVEGLGGASGALYSLLPPENATGNWVKVVQRLPVRIRFEQGEDPPEHLRPGESVEVKVWLR